MTQREEISPFPRRQVYDLSEVDLNGDHIVVRLVGKKFVGKETPVILYDRALKGTSSH